MMKALMMVTGWAARLLPRRERRPVARAGAADMRGAEALAAMRDANMRAEAQAEAEARDASLGGCYHDGVAYSLAYDANGVVELDGKTFTNLSSGLDGGVAAALRRHRQEFDPGRDIPRFIVALRPVKAIEWRAASDTRGYGLPPGPEGKCELCRANGFAGKSCRRCGKRLCGGCSFDGVCDLCRA